MFCSARASTILAAAFAALFMAPITMAAESHPFSIHDMLAMDRISDAQTSPDGKRVVFVLRKTDLEANKGRTDLWIMDADGTDLRQLTNHPDSDTNPRWTPDSKSILFLSTRSGSSQVWQIPVDGGEARQITKEPLDISNLVVSPGGANIAFSMDVYPDCETSDQTKKRLDEVAARKTSGRIYEGLFFRHWDSWKDGRRSHVFVRALAGDRSIDLMKGMKLDSPSKPFGGPDEITFTPDGRSIIFCARNAANDESWSTNIDLFIVPTEEKKPPQCLTEDNKGTDTQPVFSPDGKTLAYLSMARAGYEADRLRIVLRDWPDGKSRVLTEDWDFSAGGLTWSPDSKTLYCTAANRGQQSIFAIDAATGKAKLLVEEGNIDAIQIAGDRLIYGLDHLKAPLELYSVKTDGSDAKQITHINDKKVAEAKMGDFEQFSFKGWNDETVYAYVVKPIDFDASKKYPVAFLIHGGPQGSFGNHFHYRWNPQTYAGAGYAAVMVDFHGSSGYGQAFCDSIRGDWGGKPLEDLKKGLAAALDKYNWMDKDRVAALGASYGGYMINWIAGNWPDGFRCLVCHDGNLDERMAYFDTEELWFPEWDHQGTPWDHPEHYTKHNPIDHLKNWKTPMLVIHGGQDFRVVETQGMSTFTALQRMGIPSKFLYFPDENHWVLKPANSILWHETVISWLDQWTKK